MPPVNITGATGQRPSRSGRSQTARIARPEAKVKRQDFDRPQLALKPADISSFGGVGGALSSFFEGRLSESIKADDAAQKESDRLEIMKMEALVMGDRVGARDAMVRGDPTGFISASHQNRKAVAEAFEGIAAKTMANDDINTDIKQGLKDLDSMADPQQWLGQYIAGQTEGGSPVFASNYAARIQKEAQPLIENFRAARVKQIETQAETGVKAGLDAELLAGEIPVSPGGLQAARGKAVSAMPHLGAERFLEADAIFDNSVITAAAARGGHALELMLMKEPNVYDVDGTKISGRDGTSIADRNPGAYQKALNASMAKFNNETSVNALQDFSLIRQNIQSIQDGTAHPSITPASLFTNLYTAGDRHGKKGQYNALHSKLVTMRNAVAINDGVFNSVAKGFSSNVGNGDWNKLASQMMNPEVHERVAQTTGIDVKVVRQRMRNEWAKRGGSTSSKQAASNTLQTGANGDQVQEVYENMKFADGVRDLPMDSKTNGHLSPAAAGMYQLMLQSERSYGDPMQMRAEFLEAQKNSTTSLNLRSHYRDQPKGDKGQTNGAEGEEAMVREVYDAMSDVSGENWDDVSAAVRADIARTVNMSSALLSGSGGNKEEAILAMATGLMKHNLAMAQDSQGNRFTTIASTPSMTVDRKGNLVPSVKMDAVTLDRFDLATDTPEHQQVSDIMGDTGIVNDAMTAAGHGAQVTMSKGGFETPMVFSAGKAFTIHQDNLPEGGVPPGLFKFVSTDPVSGQHTFKLPDAPKAGEGTRLDVTKNMFLLYEKNTGNWSMRYRDSGPPSTTIKDISDKASAHNAAQRAKIDENRDKYPRQASRERWAKRFDPDNSAKPDGSEPALQVGDEPVDVMGGENDDPSSDMAGGLGWPTAGEEHITPVTEEQVSSTKSWIQKTLSSLKEAGLATASAIQEEWKIQTASEDGAGSGQDRVETVMGISKQQGNRVESTDTDSSDTFDARLADTVISHEGTSLVVYDDALGKGSSYKEGSKGEPTVGYGFNLNRSDARDLIEGEGLDYDKVRSGEAIVPEAAARNLLKYVLKRSEGYVRTTFKTSKLADHQVMALTSMTYNSRWTSVGPTIIGPNLKSAIFNEKWEDAAFEIAWKSEKAPAHLRAGIHARRMREALQFLGPEAAAELDFMQPGYTPPKKGK